MKGGDDGHDGEHHDSCHIGSADQSEHEADECDHDADMKQSKANRHIELLRRHRCLVLQLSPCHRHSTLTAVFL